MAAAQEHVAQEHVAQEQAAQQQTILAQRCATCRSEVNEIHVADGAEHEKIGIVCVVCGAFSYYSPVTGEWIEGNAFTGDHRVVWRVGQERVVETIAIVDLHDYETLFGEEPPSCVMPETAETAAETSKEATHA